MGADTAIEWAHHTFNPWVGCAPVSGACDHCYAETWAKRTGHPELWQGERRRTAPANWRQPYKWNAAAIGRRERHRVFCASLADVFDNQVDPSWRDDLFFLIRDTPMLDWLLLTKRPQNIAKMLPDDWGNDGYRNVWLGTTVENQTEAGRRIPHLLAVPARVRFLSCEPLLGRLDLWLYLDPLRQFRRRIDWVIVGGESGPGARPMNINWVRALREQCQHSEAAFLFKQHGEWVPTEAIPGGDLSGDMRAGRVQIVHSVEHTAAELLKRSVYPGDHFVRRLGKKVAGRLLDGIEHNAFPEARS